MPPTDMHLIIACGRIPRARGIFPRLKHLHLLLRQPEIEDIGILLDPRRRNRLRKRHKPLGYLSAISSSHRYITQSTAKPHLLQTPPQQDLRRRLPILLPQPLQHGLLKPLAPHDGAISLDHHPPFPAPPHDIRSRKPGMEFPLPDADFPAFAFPVLGFQFLDIGFEFVEVVEAVVGDADGADAARLLGFEEGEPGAAAGFFAAVGGVD